MNTRPGLPQEEFDLAVIGAGIHGSMAALEASRRGLRVVIVDRGDFGGATSWSSLRILHGGIRYLQKADLVRFRESVRSRSWYVREFPTLVQPLECLMPVYGQGLRRPLFLRFALALNHLLRGAWSSPEERDFIPDGALLAAEDVIKRFPAVRQQGLRGGLQWFDGFLPQPQRVVMELLRRAQAHGATALNYVEATGFSDESGAVSVTVNDRARGQTTAIRCRAVLNCAGPWATGLNRVLPASESGLTLAFNVLLDRPLGSAATVAVDPAQGGRTYFLCPQRNTTLAGTFHARSTSADTGPTDAQIEEFLADLRSAVPDFDVTSDDVLRVLAGNLPAATRDSDKPAVRDTWSTPTGPAPLFTLVGTKYTTAPSAAHRAIDEIFARCFPTAHQSTAAEPETRAVPDWAAFLAQATDDPQSAASLVRSIVAEESVTSLEDLLLRRTDWGLNPADYRAAEAFLDELCPDLIGMEVQGRSPST